MEHSPFWETNSYSSGQEIPSTVWNPKFITLFTRAHRSLCSCIVIILTKKSGIYPSCVSWNGEGIWLAWVLRPLYAAVSRCCLNTHSVIRVGNLPGPIYACGDNYVIILTQKHSICKFQELIKNYIPNLSWGTFTLNSFIFEWLVTSQTSRAALFLQFFLNL